MGLDKLAWAVVGIILLIAVFFLPPVRNFLTATYTLIGQFNSGFFGLMPSWFGWMVSGIVIATLIYLAKSLKS